MLASPGKSLYKQSVIMFFTRLASYMYSQGATFVMKVDIYALKILSRLGCGKVSKRSGVC